MHIELRTLILSLYSFFSNSNEWGLGLLGSGQTRIQGGDKDSSLIRKFKDPILTLFYHHLRRLFQAYGKTTRLHWLLRKPLPHCKFCFKFSSGWVASNPCPLVFA